jgi:acyl transferase domain-containing protein/acyl-CoA synthetase (AMP-forming)/AMP-acid ligase II/thioesterase domain-containing protein/acyl carrier protein
MSDSAGVGVNGGPAPAHECGTLVQLLRRRARHQPEQRAYTFLTDGEAAEVHLSFQDLDRQARALAGRLQALGLRGARALLLYPPGLDYIAALFGCLYAEVLAVPTYPPRRPNSVERLRAVARDCGAAVVLTTPAIRASAQGLAEGIPELPALRWLTGDELAPGREDDWREPPLTADSLAFLQYTSGSTAAPRGVLLTHGNLMHNSALIYQRFGHSAASRGVIWLPPYHDMGLVGGILQPLYGGFPVTLLAPAMFLQSPFRWLQAISRTRATTSGGPDFAYELCVRRTTPEQRATLDLSCWEVAFNGAEPIRPETLERFAAAFEPCGFRPSAFLPCYGLAESTLFVTGRSCGAGSVRVPVREAALERHQVAAGKEGQEGTRLLAGSGQVPPDHQVLIVDPETCRPCAADRIGEIWVAGPSVARSYWDKPEETARTFQARLADSGKGPYLRTGDLGFLQDGELFVTGRLKDLLIIRGQNHYPQDFERTVERCHPALRPGCCAAFSVKAAGEERLVVAAELDRHSRHPNVEDITGAVRQAVAEAHEVEVYALVLLRFGGLPKTPSGKIQRHACRAGFLDGSLPVAGQWALAAPVNGANGVCGNGRGVVRNGAPDQAPTVEAIRAWLVARLAKRLNVTPDEIDVGAPFTRYGLDSLAAVTLAADLEIWLKRRLDATLIYDYPTITLLAGHLATESAGQAPCAAQPAARPTLPASPAREAVSREPIAVIGLSCRFPGARDPEAFWRLLRDGVDAITEVPADRWDVNAYYDPNPAAAGKMTTRWGGFLDQLDQFDPHFFGISSRDAAHMDPQHRLLLELAWEAFEDAGQVPARLAGTRAGVFIGISTNDYGQIQLKDPRLINAYWSIGNSLSIAANRLSHVFDLRGPSLAIDTGCSSSLVAVHLACRSLWSGESMLAVAGGVNAILSPAVTINFAKGGALARDGRCKAFDARADGIVRGEGAGLVILKPLSKALADQDPIYAVIRGSAINQDGRSNGLTAPSRQAQEAVLHAAYHNAGVSPGRVQYVEGHGTGTLLGDPIEAKALGTVLAVDRPAGHRCAIGSVKTNIGHTEAAAGIAGLIKVALSLKHRLLPPSLHFRDPNPHIPFAELPLRVQQTLGPWPGEVANGVPADTAPRLAGVSAFGFGGTNAHVVLEQAVPPDPAHQTRNGAPSSERAMLLPLSARSPEGLVALARDYQTFLEAEAPSASLAEWLHDICYTASLRRTHHDHRLGLVFGSRDQLSERLGAFVKGEVGPGVSPSRPAARGGKLVFVFSGQGAPWWGMGRELLKQEPVFRATLQRCHDLVRELAGWSLLEELAAPDSRSRLGLEEMAITQTALFAFQVALAALWESWGIKPDAVVGHSMGEVAAAHVAGVLDLRDALQVIYHRGRLMQQGLRQLTAPGAMATVRLSPDQAKEALRGYEDRLSIAAHNSPKSLVLSGEAAALEEVVKSLQRRRVPCRLLHVPGAGHCPQVEPARAALLAALQGLQPRPASCPIYSTVTGKGGDGLLFDAAYWGRNLRETVRFADAMQSLGEDGYDSFLEISPHTLLEGPMAQCLQARGQEGTVLPSLRLKEGECELMLSSLAKLYALGRPVDWATLYPHGGRCVRLPSYPWQRSRCWLEFDEQGPEPCAERTRELVLPETRDDWFYEVRWEPKALNTTVPDLRPSSDGAQGTWLILADSGGIARELATRLAAGGDRSVLVFPGKEFVLSGDGHFRIRPDRPEDVRRLLEQVLGPGRPYCRGVVHLWSLDAPAPDETTVASLETAQTLGCGSVVPLVQHLARTPAAAAVRLWLVTRGAQPFGDKPVAVAQVPLWGLGRTLSQEHPALWGGLVDLDPDAPEGDLASLLGQELARSDTEDQVAIRQGKRYVARLAPKRDLGKSSPPRLHPDGAYLLTGGLGDLGLLMARWLVERGARRLILMGRTPLPPRAQWKQTDAASPVGRRIAAVRELEALGASVHLAAVDLGDEAQLAAFLANWGAEGWPPIRGVVHLAGTVNGRPLLDLDAATLKADLRAKVTGGWQLHRLLADHPLDFFVQFSSGASVLSSPFLGAYAAANAFLDGLAHYRRAIGRPALSVNWGFWAEAGMGARQVREQDGKYQRAGLVGFSNEQGLAMLERLFGHDSAQVVAMPFNWQEWKATHRAAASSPLLSYLVAGINGITAESSHHPVIPSSRHPAPGLSRAALLAEEPAKRPQLLESYLREQVARPLGIAPSRLDIRQPLHNLGIDSLMALELKGRIEGELGLLVPVAQFLEGPSVARLAALLLDQLGVLRGPCSVANDHGPPTMDHPLLVPLQPRGSGPPFFCVHPVEGTVQGYRALADLLGNDRPFYGIQAQRPEGKAAAPSVEEMAATYLEAVRSVQAEGPYLLGGWSMGGLLAYEMAQQLSRDGGQVAFLALLDQTPGVTLPKALEPVARQMDRLGDRLCPAELGRLISEEQLRQLFEHLDIAQPGASDSANAPTAERLPAFLSRDLLEVYQRSFRALRAYQIRPSPTHVWLIRAADSFREVGADATLGWGALARGGVEVHCVPGTHHSMMRLPHVRILADKLQACLAELGTAREKV